MKLKASRALNELWLLLLQFPLLEHNKSSGKLHQQCKTTNTPVTPTHEIFPAIGGNNNGRNQMNLSNNNQEDVQTNLPLTPTGVYETWGFL